MKKLLVAAVTALVVALGLLTVSTAGASASTAGSAPSKMPVKHGPMGRGHGHHGGHHGHHPGPPKPYPGTVKTHAAAYYSPWVASGGTAYIVGAVSPYFASGTISISVTGDGFSQSGSGPFLAAGPLTAGKYTVTVTFTPTSGSVYAPSSSSYPLWVFPSWS